MRVFSPSFNSRWLFAIGTGALLVLVILLITGGFTIQAGPIRLSAHHWTTPFAITILAWLGAALHGRANLGTAACSASSFLDRHATAGAIVLAAGAAATGLAFGTYSASSADASGYVSHAELLASGRFVRDEPLAREVNWPEAGWAFSPLGYRPGLERGQIAPGYPLGLPLTMIPPRLFVGEIGPFLVVPLMAALAVVCTYFLGSALHSRTAGLVAAALFATSPIVLFQVVQPMSDVPAAAWWALATACALAPRRDAAFAAGVATGIAVLTRPNLLPLAAAVGLLILGWPMAKPRTSRMQSVATSRLWLFAAGLVPSLGAQALIQWRLYGSPFSVGYGDIREFFALSNVTPNLRDYSWRLITGETGALVLAGCALIGVVAAARSQSPLPHVKGAALVAALVGGVTLAVYLPYGVFPDWSYLRFLLPSLPPAFVLIGALTVNAAARLPDAARGVTLVIILTAVCSFNVVHAEREQAFNLRRYEARYRDAGRYLKAAVPSNTVIVTSQQSGSASHYTGLPVVRWDLLSIDIDTALTALHARGRYPVVLIEDWEIPAFRAKFSSSVVSRLDWQALAEFGDETRVLLFDPASRDVAGHTRVSDRVH